MPWALHVPGHRRLSCTAHQCSVCITRCGLCRTNHAFGPAPRAVSYHYARWDGAWRIERFKEAGSDRTLPASAFSAAPRVTAGTYQLAADHDMATRERELPVVSWASRHTRLNILLRSWRAVSWYGIVLACNRGSVKAFCATMAKECQRAVWTGSPHPPRPST